MTKMRELSVSIPRGFADVAAFLAQPLNYPRWASGLAAGMRRPAAHEEGAGDPCVWYVQAPQGESRVRFSPANASGVADHWVKLPDGQEVHIPLRVSPDGRRSVVTLTLLRQPDVDDARFEADVQWVQRDLAALKRALDA
ncbi:MAG: SRPBCC family protein [Burkholderiales bacterium]